MPRDWVAAVARLISLQTFYTAIHYLGFIFDKMNNKIKHSAQATRLDSIENNRKQSQTIVDTYRGNINNFEVSFVAKILQSCIQQSVFTELEQETSRSHIWKESIGTTAQNTKDSSNKKYNM